MEKGSKYVERSENKAVRKCLHGNNWKIRKHQLQLTKHSKILLDEMFYNGKIMKMAGLNVCRMNESVKAQMP